MKKIYRATGKRKTSVAQVMLTDKKTSFPKIMISTSDWNKGVDVNKYFPSSVFVDKILKPLLLTKTLNKFIISIKIHGGGFSGQTDAVCHGLSRALLKVSAKHYDVLKGNKLLTRDSRVKERKKYGLKKARKAPQFSKR